MTTSPLPTRTPDTTERPARGTGALMLTLAGGALVAGSLLYVAGMVTSPPQDSPAAADYIAALGRDEGRTTLSAMLLHYGNTALALAWLGVPALVRGRRGRVPTVVGALMSALGLVTVAGFVLYDYWTGAIGRELDPATALGLYDAVGANTGVAVVGVLTLLGLLGPIVGYAGLARAGVTGWWLLLPAVGCLVASAAIPFSPLVHGALAAVGAGPTVVVGLRMVRRARAEAAVAA
ncbi:hypothetical protein SAMN05660690_1323 [Geodermatophilus telluris]|uniref:DUF4386 family protein n=1 Tax=Geodermatophilus telluris TaxID=1190417 RepID=A0A1G6LE20_9ACTN|nr:hypothetical protein [Geodermatophilus telluris]SDC41025.1 hypothetical protein SAMN05660690_1323 [Geodermatophilus telluris]